MVSPFGSVSSACPPARATVPRFTPSMVNVTNPVGTPDPPPAGAMKAVSVSGWLARFVDRVTRATVSDLWTVWDTDASGSWLPTKLASPLYLAVIVWPPTLRDEVVKTATPLTLSAADPRSVVPSKKSTVPVGTPPPGDTAVTLARNATAWPNADALGDEVSAVVVP